MCQILMIETQVKHASLFFNSGKYSKKVKDHLDEKGGDSYACVLNLPEKHILTFFSSNDPQTTEIDQFLDDMGVNPLSKINLLFFSRQKPEMEQGSVLDQPYLKTNDDGSLTAVAVHGTIYNDKELAQKYNLDIKADTEVFRFLPLCSEETKGVFAAISLNDDGTIDVCEHGLKTWHATLFDDDGFHVIANIISTGRLDEFNNIFEYQKEPGYESSILFAAFSTGMDISLSTYKSIFEETGEDYEKVILAYFAWGSNAEKSEISKLKKFKEFFEKKASEENLDIEFELRILDAKKYFDEYFKITGAPVPKIADRRSKGETEETESPLAYVPFRNSMFSLLLAASAEAENLVNVDFLFGLNLSEGMVFSDNSEGWLEAMTQLIQLGGKDPDVTGTYRVIAPYFPRTKTNMLKEFKEEFGMVILEQLLEMSHSCYYPNERGEPCGKCGSCILREKAIKEINNDRSPDNT